MVPRCETPLSIADSELSEISESYLSSDWSVTNDWDWEEEDDIDVDVTGSDVIPADQSWPVSQPFTPAPPKHGQFTVKEAALVTPALVFPASCGRSNGGLAGFDWMEDYMTPEVVDLLADDWFAAADNICLRNVVVM